MLSAVLCLDNYRHHHHHYYSLFLLKVHLKKEKKNVKPQTVHYVGVEQTPYTCVRCRWCCIYL